MAGGATLGGSRRRSLESVNIGAGEAVIILVIVLLVFGGAKLPEIARSIGQAQAEFRRGLRDEPREDVAVDREDRVDPAEHGNRSPEDGPRSPDDRPGA